MAFLAFACSRSSTRKTPGSAGSPARWSAPTAEHWIRGYESDPDAVRLGVDPERMLAETLPRLPEWNALGTALCRRFLAAATPA